MISDSLIVPDCIYRRGSFSGLMTIYESNYIKFLNIYPNIELRVPIKNILVSHSDNDHDLFLTLDYEDRYTTSINLTYRLELNDELVLDPNLNLKIYHDAKLIEANSNHTNYIHSKIKKIANKHFKELNIKWKNNIMLNKWLDYMIDVKHRFS
ncbi:MAG: hypothetical protein CBC38_07040 [Gammaproteobacteria bacterium TMED78]|nr:MAG: hypothetical protein CBC38_07040 [Gammaproteobacteria bacterium TMED78]|tara:strand:+ start:106 stop:564 length:459 start_codon:yes stop_codon:yes gene_type:complete